MVEQGRADLAERAIQMGLVDPHGLLPCATPLAHYAALQGAVGLLRVLILDKGVDVNLRGRQGETPLHRAIDKRQERAALWLINEASGCDLNAHTRTVASPLESAVCKGMLGVVKALVAKGVDVDAVDEEGWNALAFAIRHQQEDCALHLIEAGGASWATRVRANVGERGFKTMLELAAKHGCVRVVKGLLGRMRADGVEAASPARSMEAAAEAAVIDGRVASLRVLVEEGVDVQAARSHGLRPDGGGIIAIGLLTDAVMRGDREVALYLIEQDCDPLACDANGFAPFQVVAATGQTDFLSWLLTRFRVFVDAEFGKGGSALYWAAYFGQLEMVRWLIGKGADPHRRYRGRGRRPSEIAEEQGHRAIAAYLREQEAVAAAVAAAVEREAARAEQDAAARRGAAGATARAEEAANEAMIASLATRPHGLRASMALGLISDGQSAVVQRAIERGVLSPNAVLSTRTPLVHAAAGYDAVQLLRFLILQKVCVYVVCVHRNNAPLSFYLFIHIVNVNINSTQPTKSNLTTGRRSELQGPRPVDSPAHCYQAQARAGRAVTD